MKTKIFRKIKYWGILFLFIISIVSCKDNDEIKGNFKTTATLCDSVLLVTEGDYLTFTINLQQALSIDLLLQANFSTDGIIPFASDTDYKKELEYSTDGSSWATESDKTKIKIKSSLTSIKVRIPTVDDTVFETQEELEISFSVSNSNEVEVSSLPNIKCKIKDNDAAKSSDVGIERMDALMVFSIDVVAKTYNIIGITDKTLTDTREKQIIDNDHKQIVKELLDVLNLTPNINVIEFYLVYDEDEDYYGFVYNPGNSTKGDKWVIALNEFFAYNEYNSIGNLQDIDYNENGGMGYTLIHEYGHILTLNYFDQVDDTIGGSNIPCGNYLDIEGCTRPNSHLNQFHINFYVTPPTNSPTHVTDYALTNRVEDIAECFAYYVTQTTVETSTVSSSGALQKLNFIGSRSLAGLKNSIRSIVSSSILPPDYEIHAHKRRGKKRLSCREHRDRIFKMNNPQSNNR